MVVKGFSKQRLAVDRMIINCTSIISINQHNLVLCFAALLSNSLKTFQRAACDDQLMILQCPPHTSIVVQVAQYGKSNGTSCPEGRTEWNTTCTWPSGLQASHYILSSAQFLKLRTEWQFCEPKTVSVIIPQIAQSFNYWRYQNKFQFYPLNLQKPRRNSEQCSFVAKYSSSQVQKITKNCCSSQVILNLPYPSDLGFEHSIFP